MVFSISGESPSSTSDLANPIGNAACGFRSMTPPRTGLLQPELCPGHRFGTLPGHSSGDLGDHNARWQLRARSHTGTLPRFSKASRSPAMTRQAIRPMPRQPLGKPTRVTPARPRRKVTPSEEPIRPLQLPPLPPRPAPEQQPPANQAPSPSRPAEADPRELKRREAFQQPLDLNDAEFTALISQGFFAEIHVGNLLRYRICEAGAQIMEKATTTS